MELVDRDGEAVPGSPAKLTKCGPSMFQKWILGDDGKISTKANGGLCLSVQSDALKTLLKVSSCQDPTPVFQAWIHNPAESPLIIASNGLCVATNLRAIYLDRCDEMNALQQWHYEAPGATTLCDPPCAQQEDCDKGLCTCSDGRYGPECAITCQNFVADPVNLDSKWCAIASSANLETPL